MDHVTVGLCDEKENEKTTCDEKQNKKRLLQTAGEFYVTGHGAVICCLSTVGMMGPYQSCVQYAVLLLCCGLMIMGCSPGLACDVWCELPRRYHCARPFGLSKGRDGLGGFCANNSWVYMVGSVQIDTICFPISRLAIEYKAHNQRQRARSTPGT